LKGEGTASHFGKSWRKEILHRRKSSSFTGKDCCIKGERVTVERIPTRPSFGQRRRSRFRRGRPSKAQKRICSSTKINFSPREERGKGRKRRKPFTNVRTARYRRSISRVGVSPARALTQGSPIRKKERNGGRRISCVSLNWEQ